MVIPLFCYDGIYYCFMFIHEKVDYFSAFASYRQTFDTIFFYQISREEKCSLFFTMNIRISR